VSRRPPPGTADASAAESTLTRYFREIGAFPLLTLAHEADLARGIRSGDGEALDTLVQSNLRFVVSVAKKYQNQGVPLSDLINEGNLGLIRAAHKFDEAKGVKFISYAVWWIRQAILQALAEQSRVVRVPLGRMGRLHRISKRTKALHQALGREPTHAEVAGAMDVTEAEIAEAVALSQGYVSLDAPRTPGTDYAWLDFLADEQLTAPEDELFERALEAAVAESLASLDGRAAMILRLYFGLDGDDPITLEQIGARLGITRERVRQIREVALGRLRTARGGQALSRFFG
jgi:RNA polymerase primary sigma factor